LRRFASSKAELEECREQAKQRACPHCRRLGTLIGHGLLWGYAERQARQRVVRGRRLLCSKRYRRPGCGRTVSIWLDSVIAGFLVRTRTLSAFVVLVSGGSSVKAAWETAAGGALSLGSGYRLWHRLVQAQSELRTRLCGVAPAPSSSSRLPWTQLLAHFQLVLPGADCVFARFQNVFQAALLA
jgi:hypothetical protein